VEKRRANGNHRDTEHTEKKAIDGLRRADLQLHTSNLELQTAFRYELVKELSSDK
jgi:hypothetical protein